MRRIFTLLLGVLLVSTAFAQLERPTAVIKKASVKPVIDGIFDDVWAETDSLAIDRPYDTPNGAPTLGDAGETYWKALWDEDGFYLIVNVTDDNYWPNYLHPGGGNAWEYDKPEIYFDVNYVLQDGLGPSSSGSGHHQMAPDMTAAKENGQLNTEGNTRQHAFKVEKPNYVAEYFVPWASLTNKDGGGVDIEGEIGFDVTINDSDEANNTRRRGVWANVGPDATEAWSNMDQCGIITLEGAEVIYVTDVTISADGNITEDNQQLQLNLEVLPEDATVKSVKWIVTKADGSRVRASISPTGLITPVIDEELIIQATSADEFVYSNEITVSISGQKVTKEEINYIKNGDFTVYDMATGAVGAPWTGGGIVADGVCSMNNEEADADPWGWIMGQVVNTPYELRGDTYEFSFKMWADAAREVVIDFEDPNNGYLRYGVSPDATATREGGGKSDWLLPITTEPTWYTLTTTFENMPANAKQQMNLMMGWDTPIVYIDSVYLINVNDKALIETSVSRENSMETFRVYPNPASSKLHVEFSRPNTTVAIYNSVGVKMDEEVVFGTHHMFDVSRYSKGLYFVKANGAVVKFVK